MLEEKSIRVPRGSEVASSEEELSLVKDKSKSRERQMFYIPKGTFSWLGV